MTLNTFYPFFYALKYRDVATNEKYGSPMGMKNHYDDHGRKEGRCLNIFFDPQYYVRFWSDLNSFGRDFDKAANHWRDHGVKEGRRGSLYFDPHFYLTAHSDLSDKFGSKAYDKAAKHWIENGLREGRRTVPEVSEPIVAIVDGAVTFKDIAEISALSNNPIPIQVYEDVYKPKEGGIANISPFSMMANRPSTGGGAGGSGDGGGGLEVLAFALALTMAFNEVTPNALKATHELFNHSDSEGDGGSGAQDTKGSEGGGGGGGSGQDGGNTSTGGTKDVMTP